MANGHNSVFGLSAIQHSIPGLNRHIRVSIEGENPTRLADLSGPVEHIAHDKGFLSS